MTDHEKIKQKLEAFVDKELSEQERKLVEAHLAQCSECQHEIEVITKLHHLTKEAVPKPDADYAEHLTHQVWLKIRKQERVRAKARFFWIPRLAPILAGAATLILVAVIGIKFLSTTQETKKVKREPSVSPMAGMMKDEDKGLIDKIESGKAEFQVFEEKGRGAGARKLGKEKLATLQPKKSEKLEKADINEKREDVVVTKATEPVKTAESSAYAKKETEAFGITTKPASESEITTAKKGEERYVGAKIMEELVEPESTGIDSITTRLVTPSVRADLAEKGKITQYFVVGMEPKPVKIIKPKYPKLAQEKKFEGEAIIKVIVGLDGQVEYTEVLKSSGYGILDTAALEAAIESKFDPVIEKGRKVRALTTIPFKFPIPELPIDLKKKVDANEQPKIVEAWVSPNYPKPIEIPVPEYPKLAKEKMLTGNVVIEALVDTNGLVIDTKVLKSSNYGILDTAALKAAEKSKFKPAKQRDKKIQMWIAIPFKFLYPEK